MGLSLPSWLLAIVLLTKTELKNHGFHRFLGSFLEQPPDVAQEASIFRIFQQSHIAHWNCLQENSSSLGDKSEGAFLSFHVKVSKALLMGFKCPDMF